MIPRKTHYDINRMVGVRGLAAGVLKQALDDAIFGYDGRASVYDLNEAIPGLKDSHVNEAADFIFNPDREEDRAPWLGLCNLEEGQFQSLCMTVINRKITR